MGSTKVAHLRPLIERGFDLAGTPIAKLPPAEEASVCQDQQRQGPGRQRVQPEAGGQGGDGRRRVGAGQEKNGRQEKSQQPGVGGSEIPGMRGYERKRLIQ